MNSKSWPVTLRSVWLSHLTAARLPHFSDVWNGPLTDAFMLRVVIAAYQRSISLSAGALCATSRSVSRFIILHEAAKRPECISFISSGFGRDGPVSQGLEERLVLCGVSWLATRGLGGL